MRDAIFVLVLLGLFACGLRRPFLWVLVYAYVDIVAPQRLTYYLLNSVPVSLVAAGFAVIGWALFEDKRTARVAPRQWLMALLLAWCGFTTLTAVYPDAALVKWDWVWKAMAMAIFLPLTLTTRLRLEASALTIVLCASSIVIVGGIKTLASGGGYGVLNLMVENNSGLYEGSIISAVAIALVPLIWWLARHGTVFPPDKRVRLFAAALTFACLLIPVGTQARTGLVCIALLAALSLRSSRRRIPLLIGMAAIGAAAVALVPQGLTERAGTIRDYRADESASTRLAVWAWTFDYAKEHPFGGGFEAYRANRLRIETVATSANGTGGEDRERQETTDAARAYHSAYFEMLGEQGWIGLALWLAIQLGGLFSMERIRRRHRRDAGDRVWIAPFATALQHAHLIYLVGALFVGIALQPILFMIVALQIGFANWVRRDGVAEAGFAVRRAPVPAISSSDAG